MSQQETARAGSRPDRSWLRRLRPERLWLSVFGVSLGLFLVRFLVPVPVGQADDRDGPRLMCGLGVDKVISRGDPAFYRYAYFEYVSRRSCATRLPYPSSQVVPLEIARVLTPLFRLPGTINLIALGVVMCLIASAGIASLTTALRLRLWARLLVAAAAWLILADAAFFDVFASPYSEPAALAGLMLVAAGVAYLGRGGRATVLGLVLAGSGGVLAVLSKQQYLILAVPVGLTLILASADRSRGRGLRRFRTSEVAASAAVAAVLAVMAAAYGAWQATSHYGLRLQHIQAVDMIFTHIVTKRAAAPAELRALGLPASWTRYAGDYYWHPGSVRTNPLLPRYESKLTDANIAHYLLTHPGSIIHVGQEAAILTQQFRVTTLGDYPPSAGHPPGAYESRVAVLTWLVHRLPPRLGLLFYVPLWAAMAAVAIIARRLRRKGWHRDGAVVVLCMTGCAAVAFIPQAYFAGVGTTRHMVGTNLSTALAFVIGTALAVSMIDAAAARARRRAGPGAAAFPREPASQPQQAP